MERPEYIPFFRHVVDHADCTNLDAVIYGYIYWLTKLKNERCYASNETLAELGKTTSTTVGNSLTTLEKAGFIQRTYEDNNPHKGRLEIIPLLKMGKVSPTGVTRYHPQVIGVSPTGEQSKSIKEEHITSAAKKPAQVLTIVKETEDTGRVKKDRVIPLPYSWEGSLESWKKSPVRYLRVLCWYLRLKELWPSMTSEGKLKAVLMRYKKTAIRIEEGNWTSEELNIAADRVTSNPKLESEWTLETIEKYLTK